MKVSHITLFLLSVTLLSCTAKKVQKIYTSDNKGVTLTITAIQPVPFDPYQTTVNVKGFGHDETLPFEVYSNSLTTEKISMNWSSNSTGVLRITEGDGNVRKLNLAISKDRVLLRE
ncbi:MAG: hypothetical protein AB8B61_08245 [Cyclobacteriaceae bacterium]